ncbi:hypothetical protein GCM10010994_32920 [Chelatococcus reniformis]|uniref:Uncharacterized protein n=1 Tax=Chelatococcus reniformis TaxID=1494448 RepID=A0A916XGJ1_9HYPH|nr:hypothetical protein GCM10010994_32920 [Chelatococcus reniformis]
MAFDRANGRGSDEGRLRRAVEAVTCTAWQRPIVRPAHATGKRRRRIDGWRGEPTGAVYIVMSAGKAVVEGLAVTGTALRVIATDLS